MKRFGEPWILEMKSGSASQKMTSTCGKKLHYISVGSGTSSVLIFPGMAEPAFKYWELAHEISSQGFRVHVLDHIGHGFSDHQLSKEENHKLHVDSFQTYVDHASQWFDHLKKNEPWEQVQFVAHSMGGLIACQVASAKGVNRLVLSSPMFAINAKGLPRPVALGLAQILPATGMAPLQKEYNQTDLKLNQVTQSQKRANLFHDLLKTFPIFAKSGVTNNWVLTSLQATKAFLNNTDGLKRAQILLFQAGRDSFIQPAVNKKFAKSLPQCTFEYIPGAKHEILMEKDDLRTPVVQSLLQFLKSSKKEGSNE